MRRLQSKKVLFAVLALLLIGGGVAAWYVLVREDGGSSNTAIQEEPKVITTENVLNYISNENDISAFNEYLGPIDVTVKVNQLAATLPPETVPKLLIFAPENEAFSSEEADKLSAVPAAVADDLKYYYFATYTPTADGTPPNLELSDGLRIVMMNGREVFISESPRGFIVTDAKGRESQVSAKYVEDDNGSRIYFIDNVLLLQ